MSSLLMIMIPLILEFIGLIELREDYNKNIFKQFLNFADCVVLIYLIH